MMNEGLAVTYRQDEVSEKQREVWMFLIKFVERFGYQPSIREIAEALGVDKRAIQDRLTLLEEKGLVELPAGGRDRAIRLMHVRFEAVFDAGHAKASKTASMGIPSDPPPPPDAAPTDHPPPPPLD